MSSYAEFCHIGQSALSQGRFEEAIEITGAGLVMYPDNVPLLELLATALSQKGRYYESAILLEKIVSLTPHSKVALSLLTKNYVEIGVHKKNYWDRALEAADRSIEAEPTESSAHVSKAYVAIQKGDYEETFRLCQEALRVNPESDAAIFNISLAMLANHMWEEGWYSYNKYLHARFLHGIPEYGVPLWNGEPGKVIVCGEQGLGDAIMFSSMVPDLMEDHEVIFDTVPKLTNLFGRSFDCESHGTKPNDQAVWKINTDADFWTPAGSLGHYFRNDGGSFNGEPYLIACPERKVQWKALLDSLGDKPKIGIAWSGGVANTNEKERSLSVEDLYPILEYDADWISLQYKNTSDMPDFIHHWPRAVESDDYDDTAALIDSVDLVISVTTTAVHCAGALGKKVWTLVNEGPTWRYGTSGDRMPWYSGVELLRQKDGVWPIQEVCDRLSAMNIEKCRSLSTKTPITVLPQKHTRQSSPLFSKKSGLQRFLITGLGKAA